VALSPGTRLGQYEIVSAIGAGGMGEVYRATDTKLGRNIAIKTLPSALAQEPDRLARFQREAKVLATLNHAHIGAIYGLDEHDGTHFIAMELIEGQTLEAKLRDGALPIEDALHIALQIAEALEAAHQKGVVHRDLKPANIMLTPDGVVKVLDFGLAKAFLGDPDKATPAHSPAVSLAMTQQGLLLGTAGYMSPEQASGQATDQRSDIWAFGVLLYELLTGLPLFAGESMPHILADILRTEPDWSRLPENLHSRLRLLLERCLEKRVRDRYHSIADVRVDIEKVLADPAGVTHVPITIAQPTQPVWRRMLPTTALVAVAIAATGLTVWISTRPESRPVNRFEHQLPAGETFRFTQYNVLAFSRDGRLIAYNTTDGVYLRSMDELEARLIPGTEAQTAGIEFSPDGQTIVFVTPGDYLNRLSITGGRPIVYKDVRPAGAYLSYDSAEWILYRDGGIRRVSPDGGPPELIVPNTEGETIISHRLLPDGDSVLYSATRTGSADDAQVFAWSISTGERTLLVSSGTDARYVPSGHLIYAFDDGLYAVAFDLETLAASGVPAQVAQGVMRSSDPSGSANYGISDDGTLVYMSGASATETRQLVWVDRDGNEELVAAPPRQFESPRLSPNGDKIAITVLDQGADIYIWDFARATFTPVTFDPGRDRWPLWYPDGNRLVYSPNTADGWQTVDSSGSPEPFEGIANDEGFPTSFLPNGSGVFVFSERGNGNDDIAFVPLDDAGEVVVLLNSKADESHPEISPDGNWLAYVSNESGTMEVYVRPYPNVSGGQQRISMGGGIEPLWARNSDELELFFRRDGAVWGVRIETGSGFSASNPEVIFEGPYAQDIQGGRSYDIDLEDDRFLMLATAADPSAAPRIIIIQNWVEELKRLVPVE
jgi:serine/threonine protein kinase/Tol biopolymer transport system component